MQAHESVARYTVYRSDSRPVCKRVPLQSGLKWADARAMCDRLNEEREDKRFTAPVFVVQLENPDEALAAMRATASKAKAPRTCPA